MAYTLTNEEKLNIISQHQKSLETSKYNLQVSLLLENAVATPNATNVAYYNDQLTEVETKLSALADEADELS